jgi:hypothetical protein
MQFDFIYQDTQYTAFTLDDALAAGVPMSVLASAAAIQAKGDIDTAAGNTRMRYITTGPGQETTYTAKASQAEAYLAAGAPADTSGYTLLAPEAKALGVKVKDLANTILATRDQWLTLAGVVEATRLGGKKAIDEAVTVDAVIAARDAALAKLATL